MTDPRTEGRAAADREMLAAAERGVAACDAADAVMRSRADTKKESRDHIRAKRARFKAFAAMFGGRDGDA